MRVDRVQVVTIGADGVIQCGGGLELPGKEAASSTVSDGQAEAYGRIVPKPADGIWSAPGSVNPGFAPKLYGQLSSTAGNVFFSPYSIMEAMAMVHAGAGGNTAIEIAEALSIAPDSETLASRIHNLRLHLSQKVNKGENQLKIANALCVTGMEPLQSYQEIVRAQFEGELFSGGLDRINAWVKEKTAGRIEKILEQLDPNSACVLLNAVYFKGNWETPFKASKTHKAPFRLTSGKKITVDMMSREGGYTVFRDEQVIAVELPYETSASMVLLLPAEENGLAALEAGLNETMLLGLLQQLDTARKERAKLFMPRFKLATSYSLVDPLKQLGVMDALNIRKADFKAMYGETPVAISQITHKATLEVDEMGSVASAATAVEMSRLSAAIEQAPQIRFDRPFLCMIRERSSGTILFMGRVSDPTKE